MINAKHPLQSREWGEFREKTGVLVVRQGKIQVTIHKIPYTPWKIGYCPKGPMPDNEQVKTLREIATNNNCIYIKCEPKVEVEAGALSHSLDERMHQLGFEEGRPLFTKHNFILDVTPSEEILLASFKQKTRYNIKVAEKKGVKVMIDDSQVAFERYLELTGETTLRQGFYAHGHDYHKKMWQTLHPVDIAHLLVAKYEGEIITTWILFKYGETLYYPYGASTREHREVMANNLVMWEAIKLAKKWGLKYLDMWGALGSEPDKNDPWYGFHNFKAGYNPRPVEYIGTWDYVAKPVLYKVFRVIEKLRWSVLKILKK